MNITVSSLLLSQFQSVDRISPRSYLGTFVDGGNVKTDGRGEEGISISQVIEGCGIDLAVVFQRLRPRARVCSACLRVHVSALSVYAVCARACVCVCVCCVCAAGCLAHAHWPTFE